MVDMNYSSDQNPSLTPEELEIINYFTINQKQSVASGNLKLEVTETSTRLSTIDGQLLGIAKQTNDWQRKVLVTNKSIYRSIIIQNLHNRGYITRQRSSHPDFYEYHFYQVPKGYRLQYTDLLQLWRVWWHNKREKLNEQSVAVDIPIFTRGKWHVVQDLQPNQGNFTIKTAVGENTLAPEDYLVWLALANVASTPVGRVEVNADVSRNPTVSSRATTPATETEVELDLESYLNTFDTENNADVDRIDNIYNIGDLLNQIDRSNPDTSAVLSPPTSNPPSEPAASVDLQQQQQSLRLKALRVLSEYLEVGEVTTQTEVLKNALGQEIQRKITTIQRGCPRWAIEQIQRLGSADPN